MHLTLEYIRACIRPQLIFIPTATAQLCVRSMALRESAVGNKVSELHDMALEIKGSGSGSETEWGDMACRRSAVAEIVSELHDMEFNSEKAETKNPKLITDDLEVVQVEEDNVYAEVVLYDRNSTKDEPDQLFRDLAKIAVDDFIKRNVCAVSLLIIIITIFLFSESYDEELFV